VRDRRSAPSPAAAVRRFRRRAAVGLALAGFADAFAVTALLLAGVVLALRALAPDVRPAAWWAVAIGVPVAVGIWRSRRRLPSTATCAAHVDQRLALDGFLLATGAPGAEAWLPALRERLGDGSDPGPRLRWSRLALRTLPAAAVLAVTLALPAPEVSAAASIDPSVEASLRRLEERLARLDEKGVLREETKRDVEHRIERLREAGARGEPTPWSDVDVLAERLRHEAEARTAALENARGALEQALAAAGTPSAAETMAKALDAARDAGLLDTLPPELARRLEAAGVDLSTAGATLSGAGLDAETMKALAEALAGQAEAGLEGLAASGALTAADAEALDRLLASRGVCPLCKGDPQKKDACPG
jgi:hypothetical protein